MINRAHSIPKPPVKKDEAKQSAYSKNVVGRANRMIHQACGHDVAFMARGFPAYVDSQIKRYESQLCNECIETESRALDMPYLTGSSLQVDYANQVRWDLTLRTFEHVVNHVAKETAFTAARNPDTKSLLVRLIRHDWNDTFDTLLAGYRGERSASIWINRNMLIYPQSSAARLKVVVASVDRLLGLA